MRWMGLVFVGCGSGTVTVVDEAPGPTDAVGDADTDTDTDADGDTDADTDADTDTGELPEAITAFQLPGPYPVLVTSDTFDGVSCSSGPGGGDGMAYARYLPDGHVPVALVVVSHGLQRSRAQMAGHAEHWASWGLAVVAPDLCYADVWNADAERNAEDLVELGRALADGAPVVYAGHSLGAQSSFLAAAEDGGALGHFGLDLNDSEDLALDVAGGLTVPAAGLVGEPEFCNTENNGVAAYEAANDGRVLRVVGADHCDFEAPSDAICTLACEEAAGDDVAVELVVRGLATAWLMWLVEGDPAGLQWWTPGENAYDALLTEGAIEET